MENINDKERIVTELYRIIEENIGTKVQANINYLELGGNSIAAAKIIGEINQNFATDFQITKFLESDTIGVFIDQVTQEVLSNKDGLIGKKQDEAVHQVFEEGVWPVTSDQERIWFLDRINPGNPAFNIYVGIKIKGSLNLDYLNQSYSLLIKNQHLLRAKFVMEDNKVKQEIQKYQPVSIQVEKLNRSELDQKLREEASKGMNVLEGNLIHVKLFQLDDKEFVLFAKIHHIVGDGWSISIVIENLLKSYVKLMIGQNPDSETINSNYYDFIKYQTELIEKNQDVQIKFWKDILKGIPTQIQLPYDYNRPQIATYKAGRISFEMNENLLLSIRQVSKDLKITLFNFLYTAFALTLYLSSGQDEFLIGCPIANRKLPDFNKIIGFFTNTLVLKNQFSPQKSIKELLLDNYNNSNNAFNHSDIPFMTLVKNIANTREFNSNPFFQVMFSMLQGQSFPEIGDLSFENLNLFSGFADYDMFLTLEVGQKSVNGSLDYSADVLQENTVKTILAAYLNVIEQIIKNSNMNIVELKVPSDLQAVMNLYKKRNHAQKIIISSTFSDQIIKDVVSFWMDKLHLRSKILLADYNQVFNQILDPTQMMASNRDGVNVLLVRLEDWVRYSDKNSVESNPQDKLNSICNDFIGALKNTDKQFSVPVILSILPSSKSSILSEESKETLTKKIISEVSQTKHLYLLNFQDIIEQYPVTEVFDSVTDKEGHLPFTRDFYKALGTSLARKIYSIKKIPYKAIVLDCDNTLWKGVVGEDGIDKIEIDNARLEFQKIMLKQKENGAILCIVSKNEESDVIKVLKEKTDMLLKKEHFVIIKSNWDSKSENIKKIAKELNIGTDSFIFVDDNPVECAEVSSVFPEILTVEFPQEPDKIFNLIKYGWFWDNEKVTEEDKVRSLLYSQDIQRKKEADNYITFEQFYVSLQLKIEINEIGNEEVSRVSQLTFRTNQFNNTTIRRTENEIETFISQPGNKCYSVKVSDRFGLYGLVGAILLSAEGKTIKIDSLILSCRTLGKGVEHIMLRKVAEQAVSEGIDIITIPYYPSEKNAPISNFLDNIPYIEKKEVDNGSLFVLSSKQMIDFKFDPSKQNNRSQTKAEDIKENSSQKRVDNDSLIEIVNKYWHIDYIDIKTPLLTKDGGNLVKPENEIQEKIVEMVKSVLNIEQISIDENFFDLGGYSVQLVELLSKMQQQFNRPLQIIDLFKYTNIRKLADYLSNDSQGQSFKGSKDRGEKQRELAMRLKSVNK